MDTIIQLLAEHPFSCLFVVVVFVLAMEEIFGDNGK
jgi:hypothetical protein